MRLDVSSTPPPPLPAEQMSPELFMENETDTEGGAMLASASVVQLVEMNVVPITSSRSRCLHTAANAATMAGYTLVVNMCATQSTGDRLLCDADEDEEIVEVAVAAQPLVACCLINASKLGTRRLVAVVENHDACGASTFAVLSAGVAGCFA